MVLTSKAAAFLATVAVTSFQVNKLTYDFSLDAFLGPMLNPQWWSTVLGF